MTITERRIVTQYWHEDNYTKRGWDSHGWRFLDDVGSGIEDYGWTIVEHLELDKFGNPILGVAEKEFRKQ